MAEAIGLAASVMSIIQITGQVTALGFGYLRTAKNAPATVKRLIDQLTSFNTVLSSVKEYADKNSGPTGVVLMKINGPDGPVQGCMVELKSELGKLQSILTKIAEPAPGGWLKRAAQGVQKRIGMLKWPLNEDDTLEIVSRLERYQGLFTLALNLDQMSHLEKINAITQDFQKNIADGERSKALDWIYSGSFDTRHIEISGDRQQNIGNWLLESPEFSGWVQGPNKRLLLGKGIPGAGKTFLSSLVIDHFRSEARTPNYGVAYVYFNFKEQDQQTPLRVLSSLLKQLASQIERLPEEIKRLHDSLNRQKTSPTLEETYAALISTFKSFKQVFLVFDALDECHRKNQREKLLPLFHRMGKNGAKLFLTSRPDPEDISESFETVEKVTLSVKDLDIEKYILERIKANPRVEKFVEKTQSRDSVVTRLSNCAGGMFLLIRFHVDYLCKQATPRQFLEALETLSESESGLDATYDRAMNYLKDQPTGPRKLAMKILATLVGARRPLTVDEVTIAASIELGKYELDDTSSLEWEMLCSICAGFVAIDDKSNTARMVHYTAQEYIIRKHITVKDAELQLARACITYLSFDIFAIACIPERNILDERLRENPFLDYSVRNISNHVNSCDEEMTLEIFLIFVNKPTNAASYILFGALLDGIYSLQPCNQTQLHTAAGIGHYTATLLILNQLSEDLDARDHYCRTALHVATENGHESIVQLLLDKGADLSVRGRYGGTALHVATENGHESIVQLLLDKGADLSVRGRYGGTALHNAAIFGHESIVQLLLDKGGDLSVRDNSGRTALHDAAIFGHESIVQLLLDKGADPSIRDDSGNTALHYVGMGGHESIVQLLLTRAPTCRFETIMEEQLYTMQRPMDTSR